MIKKSILLAFLLASFSLQVQGQAVIFPQEKQAGAARLSEDATTFIIANDLLSANYGYTGSSLYFRYCQALQLMQSDDLFEITLGDGTTAGSSQMTLKDVKAVNLEGKPEAARGSERIPGKGLEATFSYKNLTILWRAILRNGSHYLRNELEITASRATVCKAERHSSLCEQRASIGCIGIEATR